jgi:hypothetical protein
MNPFRVQHGDARAADELLPLVYEELRRLATRRLTVATARIVEQHYSFWPFGTWVSQVRPDSGATWVNPVPAGGLGMRMRCWHAGH